MKETESYKAEIFIAGSLGDIRSLCQWYANRGLCVTVTETLYIYKGGRSRGAIVGLINYAKHPSSRDKIWAHAMSLAKSLLAWTNQDDCTIQDHEKSLLLEQKDLT